MGTMVNSLLNGGQTQSEAVYIATSKLNNTSIATSKFNNTSIATSKLNNTSIATSKLNNTSIATIKSEFLMNTCSFFYTYISLQLEDNLWVNIGIYVSISSYC